MPTGKVNGLTNVRVTDSLNRSPEKTCLFTILRSVVDTSEKEKQWNSKLERDKKALVRLVFKLLHNSV